jgi:hypothetical protein
MFIPVDDALVVADHTNIVAGYCSMRLPYVYSSPILVYNKIAVHVR